MRLLVTGGAGYVGTVLIRRILETTADAVTVLDRLDHGVAYLYAVVGPHLSRVRIIPGDVAMLETVRRAWDGAHGCIHLAGIVGAPACERDSREAWLTNATGTENVVREAAGRRVILASTGSVYGKVTGIATEETPAVPTSIYGITKLNAESAVLEASGVCLRFATMFGLSPRMRWDLLPHDFAKSFAKDGGLNLYQPEAWRTFVHVEDAATAILQARFWQAGIYNIGDESGTVTKRTLAEYLRTLVGGGRIAEIGGTDPEQRDYPVSYAKVREQTQFRVQRPLLTAGLLDVIEAARLWR